MGGDMTGKYAWMNGYSNDTMNNSALNEASSNFTIEN
jgi:hypothetical protein